MYLSTYCCCTALKKKKKKSENQKRSIRYSKRTVLSETFKTPTKFTVFNNFDPYMSLGIYFMFITVIKIL